jgi:hypothetical protein
MHIRPPQPVARVASFLSRCTWQQGGGPSFILRRMQLGDVRRDPPRLVAGEQLGLSVRFTPESGH